MRPNATTETPLYLTPVAGLALASGAEFVSPWFNVRGQARFVGRITSTQPMDLNPGSANWPFFEFTTRPPLSGAATIDGARSVPQDADPAEPAGKYVYPVDQRCLGAFGRFRLKQTNGAAATVRIELYSTPIDGARPS